MTQTAYDAFAYGGGTHPDTSPNRLAGMARLLGVAAPPPATARVLDLGCGAGRNLIPLAWYWPHARFVGVDLAQTPIDEGSASIRALGLGNIELRQGDVTQLDAARLGRFDYVIAHGLFSWVPQPVRVATLKLIADGLTPDGVAFVSYNALPGCRIRHVARDLMRFHLKGHAYDPSIVPPARALMESIRALPEGPVPAFLGALRTEAKHATANGDASLFHDDLSPENQPFYLHEFAELAAAHGLAWFGDADAETMADPDGGPEVRAWLERMSAGSALARQQYLDFLNANRFNRSLLCRADRAPAGGVAMDAAADARWTTTLRPVGEVRGDDDSTARFERFDGPGISTNHALIKTALLQLEQSPDCTITTRALAERLTGGDDTEPARLAAAAGVLMRLMFAGLLSPVGDAVPSVHTAPPTGAVPPPLSRLARHQLEHGLFMTDNGHHNVDMRQLSPVLGALDGRTTRDAARVLFGKHWRPPTPKPARDAAPVVARSSTAAQAPSEDEVDAQFEGFLATLARCGLLDART